MKGGSILGLERCCFHSHLEKIDLDFLIITNESFQEKKLVLFGIGVRHCSNESDRRIKNEVYDKWEAIYLTWDTNISDSVKLEKQGQIKLREESRLAKHFG